MGQCTTREASPPVLPASGPSINSVDWAKRFQDAETLVVQSRQVDSEAVRNQRHEAAVASSNLSRFSRSGTRTALDRSSQSTMRAGFAKMATSLRMSRMGTMKRDQMIQEVEKAESEPGLRGVSLESRLKTFGMHAHSVTRPSRKPHVFQNPERHGLCEQMVEMEGDGNCQFRTIAFNLFGNQEHHAAPRQAAVAHMKKHTEFFGVFFEDQAEFSRYLKNMGRKGTWGDELTLRAVVEAYGCVAHVVTSEPSNWRLGAMGD
ncbi:unnamed protein product, partial [Effrenium voratum]